MLEGALKRINWLTSALVPFLIVYVDFQIMKASISAFRPVRKGFGRFPPSLLIEIATISLGDLGELIGTLLAREN